MLTIANAAFIALILGTVDVSSYVTIASIEICDATFDSTPAGYDLSGHIYNRGNVDNTGIGMYLPYSEAVNNDFTFDVDSVSDRYGFISVTYGELIFEDTDSERAWFHYLFDNAESGCACDGNGGSIPADISTESIFLDVSGVTDLGNVNLFSACAVLEEINDPDAIDINSINFEGWTCNGETLFECNKLSLFLGTEYMGFEIYSNDENCEDSEVRRRDQGWRCRVGGCESGYRQFVNHESNKDHHKCFSKQPNDYFPGCLNQFRVKNHGCDRCAEDYILREWPNENIGNFCPYGFCIHEDDYDNIDQADQVNTDALDIKEGTNSTSKCMFQSQRLLDPEGAFPDELYIPNPWNQQLCMANYIDSLNPVNWCSDDGRCNNEAGCHSDGSCSQCIDGHFKLSPFHRCQPYDDLGDGCVVANEGHGCSQCNDGTPVWNDWNGVWYCEGGASGEIFQPTGHTTSPWKCPQKCENIVERGCECGCGTTSDADCEGNRVHDEDPFNCHDCHVGPGCDECSEGFFQLTNEHECTNCTEYLGVGCLECQDWQGCSKCDQENGYILTFDACCQMWYCA